jgi:hypothetical protein
MIKLAMLFCALLTVAPHIALAQDGPLSPRQFGAKGDGTTDDTRALKAWLDAVAKSGDGYCPAGIYRVGAQLDQPMHSRVAGPPTCVIKPMASLHGVAWQQGSGSILEGLAIDGSEAGAASIGLAFDLRPAPINAGIFGVTRDVAVRNFSAQGSLAVDAGSTVHWSLQNLDIDNNYDGLHIGVKKGARDGVGTNTLTCEKCEIRGNGHWGLFADAGGQEIYLNQPEIVDSGAAAIHLDTFNQTLHLSHFIINGGHIEMNAKPGGYQIQVQDVDDFVLRDTKFEPEMQYQCATRPRALRIVDGKDFLLDNVRVCHRGNAIALDGTASGRIVNWPTGLNGPASESVQNHAKGIVTGVP